MDKQTPMQKIKAYHSIKQYLSKDEQNQVANMLGLDETDLTTRLNGKDMEFQFLLMCHLLGQVKDIVAFEEAPSRLTNTHTVDFLVLTKDNRRLAVEVKSKKVEKWDIAPAELENKKKFATLIDAELYFALNLNNYWIFLSCDYVEKKNRKISVKEDEAYSTLYILGEKTFTNLKPITFKSIYNKNPFEKTIIESDCGYLTEYSIEVEGIEVLKNKITLENDSIFFKTVLQFLQELASKNSIEKTLDRNTTLVRETLEPYYKFNLSQFLIAPYRLLPHQIHGNYDLTVYIDEIFDKKKAIENPLITPLHVFEVLLTLDRARAGIAVVHEDVPVAELKSFFPAN
ncbi:hypothetical protein [Lysinibacillus xylanilyticus]|uniref:Type I restriction enzyme R protein N-terminal domain-containing protein n=1 Tax=Lysinibacillus xylanilyticus TaxID=582475 RepID=A0ABV3VYH3_9BACI